MLHNLFLSKWTAEGDISREKSEQVTEAENSSSLRYDSYSEGEVWEMVLERLRKYNRLDLWGYGEGGVKDCQDSGY